MNKTLYIFLLMVYNFYSLYGQSTIGSVERLDPEINSLIPTNAKIEILGSGYNWSEGPIWVENLNGLLFNDPPENKMYLWTEGSGVKLYLDPSGYTGYAPSSLKKGSNGMAFNTNGSIIMAHPGDRRIARFNSSFENPEPKFETITDKYMGKRFNSPNDVVVNENNDVFFTDPPYGLKNQDNDSLKELSFNGVYKYSNNQTILLYKNMTRPNGLAFSKNGSELYVANSDPKKALWYVFDLNKAPPLTPELFFDATSLVSKEKKGLPDGLKVHSKGYVFASGPGGILIFNNSKKHIGTILTEVASSNCAFNSDESYLYMTSDNYLTRIKLVK